MYSGAGQVRKSLSIKPHTDGYFISLSRLSVFFSLVDVVASTHLIIYYPGSALSQTGQMTQIKKTWLKGELVEHIGLKVTPSLLASAYHLLIV